MKRQLTILATMAGLMGLEQLILVSRAVVPAQDAVRYVAMAQMIEAEGLLASLPQLPEQPLFPILAWLTHGILETLCGDISWATAVQLAAAWSLIVCVIPVYATLRQWLEESAAIAGTLLFCSLGEVARLGADGLSDSTHLLFFCLAIWAVSAAGCRLAERSTARWAALLGAGLATGFAALTRAESLVLLPALAFSVLVARVWSGRGTLSAGLFAVGLVIAWVPFSALIGVGQARDRLLGRQGHAIGQTLNVSEIADREANTSVVFPGTLPDGEPMTFSKKESSITSRFQGYRAAAAELGRELARTLQYWVGNLALIGLWARRKSYGASDRLALSFSLLLITAAVLYAVQVGYLSSRHLLLLTPFAAGWAGVGALKLGGRLTEWVSKLRWLTNDSLPWRRAAVAWSVVAIAAVASLPHALTPLHASRWGHRRAAEWLASAAAAPGSVLDTRGWTALYTMRPTYRLDAAARALADPRLAWLVVERSEVEFDSSRGRTLRHLAESHGELMHTFRPPGNQGARDDVLLYRFQSPAAIALAHIPTLDP